MELNLSRIHHVAINCSDYERTKHFYVDLLGFQVIRENERPQRGDRKIDLKLGDCELELFVTRDCPQRLSYPEAYGLRHLAFRVDSVERAVEELNRRGIPTEPIRTDDYTGEKMTFFFDPDHQPLELHE